MQMSDDNVVALSLLNSIKATVVKRSVMMIETLATLGIDEEFIYQDLDSLCKKIKRERNIIL